MVVRTMHEESSTIFGTTEQLMIFGEIFFGTLLVAALYFGYRHIKHGLACLLYTSPSPRDRG